MSITGHKYRQFRAGRNMTGTQLGWLSCKQKKDPEKDWELVHFCLICFQEESFSASLISTPHWVILPCLLNITSLLSTSSFLVSIFQVSHRIVTPSFSPQWSTSWPYFSSVFICHTNLSHEDFSPCQALCYITPRALSPPGAAMCLKQWKQSSPCGNSLGHDGEAQDTGKKMVFPLPSVKDLSYSSVLTEISSVASRGRNYSVLPMLSVLGHSFNWLSCFL